MNNVGQKNEIFKTKRYSEIPYRYADTVNFGYSQNINSGVINNTFQQLLDNDLYVENAIRDYATSQVGPKGDDPEEIRNAYDGYKVLSDDTTQVFVLRKEDEPFGSRMETVLQGHNVNFSFCFGNMVFVGADSGLFQIDSRGDRVDLLDMDTTGYSVADNVVFFSTSDGIYALAGNSLVATASRSDMKKVDVEFSQECRSVFYDGSAKELLAGTANGAYKCGFDVYRAEESLFAAHFETIPFESGAVPTVNAMVADAESVLAATSDGVFRRFGKTGEFVPVDGGESVAVFSLCRIEDGNVVACGLDGIYRISPESMYRISDIYHPKALTIDNSGEQPVFVVGSAGIIYKSKNCKRWDVLMQVPGATAVNDIYVKNRMEFYVSTTDGLYRTAYSYRLVNDFESRNEFQMREFVQGLSGELDLIYDADFRRHLEKYHSSSSPITHIDDTALSTSLDTPAQDWCTVASGAEYIVTNGMVQSMDFGDYTTGVFRVDLSSYVGSASNVEAEYISKNYMGGVSELFIHVDTTNNYYLNFMYGTPNWTKTQAETSRSRRNLENSQAVARDARQQDSVVSSHYSTVTVRLDS